MYKRLISLLTLALLLLPVVAFSQEYNRASFYYLYQYWKLDLGSAPTVQGIPGVDASVLKDQKIHQGVLGLSATGVVSERLHVDLSGTMANSTASLEYNNGTPDLKQSLSALNDTKLRFTYSFGQGKGSGSLFFNLPTGKRSLSPEQYSVATQLADISRKFAVRRYGQGLDVGVDWFALPRWSNFGLDFGGGYLYRGKYQPLAADTRKYKYGDEIFGRLGFDTYGSPLRGSADVSATYYAKDQFDGQDVFQAGLTTAISGAIVYSQLSKLSVGGMYLMRGKAKIRTGAGNALSDEQLKSGRNELLLYSNFSYPAAEKLNLLARLEFLSVSANDYDTTSFLYLPKSHYVGFGGGLGYALSSYLNASGLLSFYTGKIDDDYGLKGLGFSLVLTIHPGQGR